ncbi:peptidylprolyl isomerase [Porticoccaceae bacterium LTM1]|nr:peptidylprolyl isomerase [Porticoccaceae bacterium LTM1]
MTTAIVRHILVKHKDQAEKLKQQIAKGADFGQMAKKHSICPSKRRGGDLGEVRKGDMVKPFEDVVFKKPTNVVHGPVKTRFGYHLIETVFRG